MKVYVVQLGYYRSLEKIFASEVDAEFYVVNEGYSDYFIQGVEVE